MLSLVGWSFAYRQPNYLCCKVEKTAVYRLCFGLMRNFLWFAPRVSQTIIGLPAETPWNLRLARQGLEESPHRVIYRKDKAEPPALCLHNKNRKTLVAGVAFNLGETLVSVALPNKQKPA